MPTPSAVAQLCLQAKEHMAKGEYGPAETLYQQAIAADPKCVDAHHGLGTIRFLRNELAEALRSFRQVIELDPMRASAYVNAGAICNRLGQLDEAQSLLLKAIQVGPTVAQAYYNLGVVYRRKGDLTRAIDAYREATHLDPNLVDGHHNMGNCFFDLKRYAEAITAYRRALEVRPDFERARKALELAEAALAEEKRPSVAAPAAPPPVTAPPAEAPAAEAKAPPEDPSSLRFKFAEVLSNCIRFLVEYADYVEKDLEPTTRELSRTLLHASQMAYEDLAAAFHKFETTLESGLVTHKSLVSTVQAVRQVGERMLEALSKPR